MNVLRGFLILFAVVATVVCTLSCPALAKAADTREITLQFHVPKSIGTLWAVPFGLWGNTDRPIGTAFGTVKATIPKSCYVKLALSREAFQHPGDIDMAPARGIQVLETQYLSLEDSESGWCDAVLGRVAAHFKDLEVLNCSNSDASDIGVEKMQIMPSLKHFGGALTNIEGACFKNFGKQFPNLIGLTMFDSQLDNATFKYLADCKHLMYVDFRKANVNPEGMKSLCRCENLQILNLANNQKIDNSCMKDVINLKHLTWLQISGTSVTMNGLKLIAPMHLLKLSVGDDRFSAKDLTKLRQLAKAVELVPSKYVSPKVQQIFAPLH